MSDNKVITMHSEVIEDDTRKDEAPIYSIETSEKNTDQFFRAPNDHSAIFSFISLLAQSNTETIKPLRLNKIELSPEKVVVIATAEQVLPIAKIIRASDAKLMRKITVKIQELIKCQQ